MRLPTRKNKPWNALLLLLIAWTLLCCCYCGWMKGLSSARKVELGCWETRMTLTLITHHAIKDMILSLNLLSRRYPIANTLSRSYIEPWDNFYFHIISFADTDFLFRFHLFLLFISFLFSEFCVGSVENYHRLVTPVQCTCIMCKRGANQIRMKRK